MIIIFEGMDRTGKDTQIKLIQKHLLDKPCHIMHYQNIKNIDNATCKKYSKILYKDMFRIIKDTKTKRHLILNRAHLGELVYGKMYRKYNASYLYNVEKRLKNINDVKLIVLIKDSNTNEDGNSLSNNDNKLIIKEKELFTEAFNSTNIPNKILINITNKSIDEVNLEIVKFLKFGDINENVQ